MQASHREREEEKAYQSGGESYQSVDKSLQWDDESYHSVDESQQ